ncbi:MAG: PTS fructose transporter subunit IIA [Alphaproteobacteria bacterium]|nr:MAG: PTS fructose transporter subunit IIA [Alphaproteobacteria bacterium]
MIGIVIVAHGGLAAAYLAAVEHVVGPVRQARAIAIAADYDRERKATEIMRAADEVDTGEGVIVVVDMFGSSPANLSLPACARENRKILYGANLPMLVKLAKSRQKPIDEAAAAALAAGRKYIDVVDGRPK